MTESWNIISPIVQTCVIVGGILWAMAKASANAKSVETTVADIGRKVEAQGSKQEALTLEMSKVVGRMEKYTETIDLRLSHQSEKIDALANLRGRMATVEEAIKRIASKEGQYDQWHPRVDERLRRLEEAADRRTTS